MAITSVNYLASGVLINGQLGESESVGDGVWHARVDISQGYALRAVVSSGSGTYKYWTASRARFNAAAANVATLAASPYWTLDNGTNRGPAATGDSRYFKDTPAVLFLDDAANNQTSLVCVTYVRN